ncbi:MAG: universal stress protein [Myxococcota bacterium]
MRTWLVAHDFSDSAKKALTQALELFAPTGGGRLVVLHVHEPGTDGFGVDIATLAPGGTVEETYHQEAKQTLARTLEGVSAPGVELVGRVAFGRPAHDLVEIAKEEGASMIVLGSHGRRGFERFLLGSVAERVVRQAECPVLVVKHGV